MTYLSLFSGIGGFELGIGGHAMCVGFSETDPHAAKVYQNHFPNHFNYGDIRTISPEDLPHFDLLVGGFPCQPFSVAGRRRGFADERGLLFFDLARIVAARKPRLLLLENVRGLLSQDRGKSFGAILSSLDELGYDVQWQVCNSRDFGVPQNRERVFLVCHLRGTPRPEVFPLGEDDYVPLHRQGKVSPAVTARYHKQGQSDPYIVAEGHPGGPWPRRLTPTECERLQGFPDGWTEGVSDTQRYRCLGNAVTVPVVRTIFGKLIGEIFSETA